MAVFCFASCGTLKQRNTSTQYSRQTVERLSKQFGLRLTQTDNLKLYQTGSNWLGVNYLYGGNTKNGVDCSGLVCILYKQVYGITLERNTANILKKNCTPITKKKLREGDLLFFNTSATSQSKTPNHVGLYLKSGKFIHAGSSQGVVVSNLSDTYYTRNWITGGRVKNNTQD